MKRTINGVPEGVMGAGDLKNYRMIDNTEKVASGVTKEWAITYSTREKYWEDLGFIVHAPTIEGAFEHFISIKPDTNVKAIEYFGIYF